MKYFFDNEGGGGAADGGSDGAGDGNGQGYDNQGAEAEVTVDQNADEGDEGAQEAQREFTFEGWINENEARRENFENLPSEQQAEFQSRTEGFVSLLASNEPLTTAQLADARAAAEYLGLSQTDRAALAQDVGNPAIVAQLMGEGVVTSEAMHEVVAARSATRAAAIDRGDRSRGEEEEEEIEPRDPYAETVATIDYQGLKQDVLITGYAGDGKVTITAVPESGTVLDATEVPINAIVDYPKNGEQEQKLLEQFLTSDMRQKLAEEDPSKRHGVELILKRLTDPRTSVDQLKDAAEYFHMSKETLVDYLVARKQDPYTISRVKKIPDGELPGPKEEQLDEETEQPLKQRGDGLIKRMKEAITNKDLTPGERKALLQDAEELLELLKGAGKVTLIALVIVILINFAVLAGVSSGMGGRR